jgi:hypothetical protein
MDRPARTVRVVVRFDRPSPWSPDPVHDSADAASDREQHEAVGVIVGSGEASLVLR